MNWHLECTMTPEPAALERVLQVLRIRGYSVKRMDVQQLGGGFLLKFCLRGERPIETLVPQLEKLHLMQQVTLLTPSFAPVAVERSA